MNDIEILEAIVKVNKDYLKGIENQTINQKEIQALENLINRVKELEYEVEKQKEIVKKYENYTRLRSIVDFYNKKEQNLMEKITLE